MSSPWEAALAILCMVFLVGVSYFILKGLSCFLLTFALLSVGWAAPIAAPAVAKIIYCESFDAKTKPPGWREWESGFHPASWDNQIAPISGRPSIIFGDQDELSMGALYDLPGPQDSLLATFLFKTPTNVVPFIFEIIDFYDDQFHEICDAYLNPSGGITLFANNLNMRTSPMPLGQVVRIWMRYQLVNGLSVASVAWAPDGECEPEDERRVTISQTDTRNWNTPVSSVLLGPWYGGFRGVYADFCLKRPTPKSVHLAVQKSGRLDGPWSTLTNFTDTIHGDTFYRLEAQ